MTRLEEKRACRVARLVTLPRDTLIPRVSAAVARLRLRTIPPLAGSPVPGRAWS